MNKRNSLVSLEHIPIHAEPSVGFTYPEEQLPEDVKEAVNKYVNDLYQQRISEFVKRLLMLMMDKTNPKTFLASLAYAAGMDMKHITGSDTITGIAQSLGCSKQNYHKSIKRVKDKYCFTKRKKIDI